MNSIAELQQQFGRPGFVKIEEGRGGLPMIRISSDLASAEIYLHGAHVTHFQPRHSLPLLFLSKQSAFSASKPIRGGVPLVFPWFGPNASDPKKPAHGFARLRQWQIEACDARSDGSVRVVLALAHDASTLQQWPHEFSIRYLIVISSALELTLEIRNGPRDAIEFEEALHTYFSVSDSRNIVIRGLDGVEYLDRAGPETRKTQPPGGIKITGETDRLYLNTQATVLITDPGSSRTIKVEKQASDATVVWNPWTQKAAAMPDFGDDEWIQMVCVESANARQCSVKLPAGGIHRLWTRIGEQA
jgi:glucose-6-phosphate 1-epimerase